MENGRFEFKIYAKGAAPEVLRREFVKAGFASGGAYL